MPVKKPDTWPNGHPGPKLHRTGPRTAVVLEEVVVFGVTIPAGYETDGASVPRAFYNVLARFTLALLAAMVHDLRYDPPDKFRRLTRKQADVEFLNNLKASGVGFSRRHAAYRAVRLFGGRAWKAGTNRGIVGP